MMIRILCQRVIYLACLGLLACSSSSESEPASASAGRGGANARTGTTSGPAAVGGSSAATRVGSAGANAVAAACPVTEPAEDTVCATNNQTCSYPSRECTCEAGQAADRVASGWNCRRARQMCPSAMPDVGSACAAGRGECMFDATVCVCSEDSAIWSCWNPADCPTTAPAERAACQAVGMECPYQIAAEELDCECTTEGWDCGRQLCPSTMPALGEACEGGDGLCTFGAQTCDCRRRAWTCWDPAACPATPAHEAACSVEGMLCAYGSGECECEDAAWSCDSALRPRDDDAGA